MANSCTFDPSKVLEFPYQFRYPNGSIITQGYTMDVHPSLQGFGDASVPVCIFDTSACASGKPVEYQGSSYRCCEETKQLGMAADTFLYPLLGFMIPMFLAQIFFRRRQFKRAQAHKEAVAKAKAEGREPPKNEVVRNPMATMVQDMPKWQWILFGIVFCLCIGAMVTESVIMPKSIQTRLKPADRSAQLAMSSFLTPMAEIFSFLEDTMMVKVGYAIASRRYKELNALLHIGALGGLLCGVVAFAIAGIMAASTAIASAILNPSSASNVALISGGCSLIPTTSELLVHARAFWLLSAASWIPKFTSLSIFGFLTGAGRVWPQVFSMVIGGTVPIILWFTLLGTDMNALTILGVAYGAKDWILGALFIGYLLCSRDLLKQYQLRLFSCCSRRADDEPGLWGRMLRSVVKGGVDIMAVDLAVQLSITITIYLAASDHMETAYKLAAAQAAYWTFGPQYMFGTNMILKIVGARLIATGKAKMFGGFFIYVVVLTSCVGIAAILAALTHSKQVAADFGESACIFATEPGCAGVFASIFKGDDPLSRVFDAFGPTVLLQLFFIVLRAGLAACHDFSFMWRAAVGCFVIGYIPSIIIAHTVYKTALSYYVAMYMPHFLMLVVFGYRMKTNLHKLFNGLPGSWTAHSSPEEDVSTSNPLLDGATDATSTGGSVVEVPTTNV